MKIICPKCHTEYNVDKKHLTKTGRKTECYVCKTLWIQYPTGKALRIKELDDFIDQIKVRQASIKASLNLGKSLKNSSDQRTKTPIKRGQEKDLLAALAMDEIQENRISSSDQPSLDPCKNSGSKEIENSLLQEEKFLEEPFSPQKKINKTFLGFSLISALFVTGIILYTDKNLINLLDPKYQKYLLGFIETTDTLLHEIQNYILQVKNHFFF